MELDVHIREVCLQSAKIALSKRHRLSLIAEPPMVLIGAENVRSQYVDAKADILRWEEPFGRSFSVTSTAECCLLIELIQRQVGRTGRMIGRCSLNLAVSTSQEQSVPVVSSNGDLIGTLHINLDATTLDVAADLAQVANARNQVKLDARAGATDTLAHISAEIPVKTRVDSWDLVRSRLGTILDLGDRIAEVHPWAKLAWGVVSATLRVISAQSDRDDRIDSLIEAMANSLEFVNEARPLHEYSQEHRVVITKILQQIIQCTYFVRDYSKDASFGVRAARYMISGVDAQIDAYTTNLFSLVESLRTRSIVKGMVMLYRMLEVVDSLNETVQDIHALHLLNEMKYSSDAQRDLTHACLPGTRVESVEAIVRWAAGADRVPSESEPDVWGLHRDADDTSRVLWLCGVAGSGKSTILRSVAARLAEIGRLGTFYAFSQATQATTKPENLFSTIARNLADLDAVRKQRLIDVIKDDTVTRTTTSGRVQFERFIMDACSNVPAVGDTVVFIDAFDESGDAKARAELLFILTRRAAELPAGLRFVITSRFEPDVQRALETVPLGVKLVLMHDIPSPLTSRDISAYVQTELSVIEELENHASSIEKLAQMAATSFQWASTACRFIKDDDFVGYRPQDQLQTVLSSGQGLDQLYDAIMRQHCDMSHAKGLADLQLILGCVICAEIPIPLSTLDALLPASLDVPLAYQRRTLRHLGSLLSGTHRDDTPIAPLHTSYSDFLRDPERSGPFFVDVRKVHQILARGCFEVMQVGLRFNICQFPSSYLSNVDVNIEALVSARISFSLSYACKYWTSHVTHCDIDEKLLDAIERYLDIHSLHWLEVMSATRHPPLPALSLLDPKKLARPKLTELLREMKKFCSMFAIPIAKSTPHIYLSGLAFAPAGSIFQSWQQKAYRGTVHVQRSRQRKWPDIVHILRGHKQTVNSVAFSPDGRYAASASDDMTVILWDIEGGVSIGAPLKGHSGAVTSVCFSPDGRYIASSSRDGTLRLWDIKTSLTVKEPLLTNCRGDSSVTFSPNGRYLASCSTDRLVLWDVIADCVVPPPPEWSGLAGNQYHPPVITFSPDEQCLVVGNEGHMCIWNLATQEFWQDELRVDPRRHREFLPVGMAIAWSRNNIYVVCGPEGGTLVWFAQWRMPDISRLQFRHLCTLRSETGMRFNLGAQRSLALSSGPQSSRMAGCSSGTIYVWDDWRKAPISRLLSGHTKVVTSVVYSPDSRYLLSGSMDSTVRLWDAAEPIKSTSRDAQIRDGLLSTSSILTAYSADGQRIVLYANGHLCLWDVGADAWQDTSPRYEPGPICFVSFAPSGKELLVGCAKMVGRVEHYTIMLWDVETLTELWARSLNTPNTFAFSPDGQYLALGVGDGVIRFLDVHTGEEARESLGEHDCRVDLLVFSSDSQKLVSGHSCSTFQVWDLRANTDTPIFTAAAVEDATNIAFSPNGQFVAVTRGDDTKTIHVHSFDQSAVQAEWKIEDNHSPVTSIIFSPNSRRMAVSASGIRVFDMQSRGCILERPFKGKRCMVKFTPSSDKLEIWRKDSRCGLHLLSVNGPDPRRHPPHFVPGPNGLEMKDGWLVGPEGELILWIPPAYREHISKPDEQNLGDINEVDLDFRDFKCGEDWAQCYTGPEPES